MTYYRYEASNLHGHVATQRTNLFKVALLAAMGTLALQGKPPLFRDTLSAALRGWIAFYPNEVFMPAPPRILVAFIDKDEREGLPARVAMEIDYTARHHKRAPVEIDVYFPDRLLGLGKLVGAEESDTYNGLFFNSTPGELNGNLFEAVNAVSAAYAETEALYDNEGAQAVLDNVNPGRMPTQFQDLHQRVL